MNFFKKMLQIVLVTAVSVTVLTGCGSDQDSAKTIVRIGHNQSSDHPTHIALTAF